MLINKTTQHYRFDWLTPWIRHAWTAVFAFYSIYILANTGSLSRIDSWASDSPWRIFVELSTFIVAVTGYWFLLGMLLHEKTQSAEAKDTGKISEFPIIKLESYLVETPRGDIATKFHKILSLRIKNAFVGEEQDAIGANATSVLARAYVENRKGKKQPIDRCLWMDSEDHLPDFSLETTRTIALAGSDANGKCFLFEDNRYKGIGISMIPIEPNSYIAFVEISFNFRQLRFSDKFQCEFKIGKKGEITCSLRYPKHRATTNPPSAC